MLNRSRILAAVLAAAIIVLLTLPACSTSSSVTTIGVFIGLSGNIAVYGESQKKGIELAVDEINSGSLAGNNRIFNIIYQDSGPDTDGAVAAVQKLIDGKVSGLIGPTLSSQALAADPLAQQKGIPVIAISNTVPGIVEMGDCIFRCSLPESSVIKGMLKKAVEKYRIKTVGLLWGSDQALSIAGREAFLAAAREIGVQVLGDQSYLTGATDYRIQLKKLIESKPDALCVAALAGDTVSITVQTRELGFQGNILGSNGFNSPDLIKQAGAAAEGILVGTAWDKNSTVPENQQFIQAFEKQYGFQPDQFAAQAYTAVKLYARAVNTALSGSPADIRRALAGIRDMPAPLGNFSFDTNRDAVSPAAVQVVQNGAFVVIN